MADESDEGLRKRGERAVHLDVPEDKDNSPVSPNGPGRRPSSAETPDGGASFKKLGTKVLNMRAAAKALQETGLDSALEEPSLQRPLAQEEKVPTSPTTPSRARAATGEATSRKPVFGDIRFAGASKDKDHTCKYCIIGAQAKPDIFYDVVANHLDVWNLEAPRLMLSIMGGAAFFQLAPEIEQSFSEGLTRVAKQTRAWVITGGTSAGVMALVGKALATHDKKRTVPLVGITSFGSLRSNWRAKLDVEERPDRDRRQMLSVDSMEVAKIETPARENPLAGLQENHSFLILCDSGKRGFDAFGNEANFRATFEKIVASKWKGVGKDPKMRRRLSTLHQNSLEHLGSFTSSAGLDSATSEESGQPSPKFQSRPSTISRQNSKLSVLNEGEAGESNRVMILVNGGPISFESVHKTLETGCPVVVCRGSGRGADFLSSMKDNPSQEMKEAWDKSMTDADQKAWNENWSKSKFDSTIKNQKHSREVLQEIVESERLVIFSHTDRLEDVVIGAILKKVETTKTDPKNTDAAAPFQSALDLAVEWQCEKHCRDLLTQQLGFHLQIGWILKRFTRPEWLKADASHVLKIMLEGTSTSSKSMLRSYDTSAPFEFHTEDTVEKEIKWEGITNFGRYENSDQTPQRDSLAILFIWLIENGASGKVVDTLWCHLDFPAHAALAAAHCLREMSDRDLHSISTRLSSSNRPRSLGDEADRYEKFASLLLQAVSTTEEFLFRPAPAWGNMNLLRLAHHLECKEFVMEQHYQAAIMLLWLSPSPFETWYFDEQNAERKLTLHGKSLLELAWMGVLSLRSSTDDEEDEREGDDDRKYAWLNTWIRDWNLDTDVNFEEFWSIPKVKCITHNTMRVIFILTYSYYVLYSVRTLVSVVLGVALFIYGLSLAAIEVLQLIQKGSFWGYLSGWNIVDVLLISLLLGTLLSEATLIPLGIFRHADALCLHAINLLPCYLRLLQMFELSEFTGTLFRTFFDMYKDAFRFMVLLSIVGLGFGCCLTPMLWTSPEARWKQGNLWVFWAIFGDVADEKEVQSVTESNLGFLLPFLRYFLYFTLNVLLVNLLISQMNDSYSANKEESKRIVAFTGVDAVLEFASEEAHPLPPPFDLGISVDIIKKNIENIEFERRLLKRALMFFLDAIIILFRPFLKTSGMQHPSQAESPLVKKSTTEARRLEKRAIAQEQLRLINEDQKNETEVQENAAQEIANEIQTKMNAATSKIDEVLRKVTDKESEMTKFLDHMKAKEGQDDKIKTLEAEIERLKEENGKAAATLGTASSGLASRVIRSPVEAETAPEIERLHSRGID
jgi:hypothetical protein